MLPGSDYVLQFARLVVQILVLLFLLLSITRYPDLINDLSGVVIDVELHKGK